MVGIHDHVIHDLDLSRTLLKIREYLVAVVCPKPVARVVFVLELAFEAGFLVFIIIVAEVFRTNVIVVEIVFILEWRVYLLLKSASKVMDSWN